MSFNELNSVVHFVIHQLSGVLGFDQMEWIPDWNRGLLKGRTFLNMLFPGDDFFKVIQSAETYFAHFQRFYE